MKRLKEFLFELLLVFKAPQGIHGSEDVLVNELFRGNDVCLDHFHHGSFEFQFAFAACSHPWVAIDFLQL